MLREVFTIIIISAALSVLALPDSIRDVNKYSSLRKQGVAGNNSRMGTLLTDSKLFRSERNYYMSGITVFIWL